MIPKVDSPQKSSDFWPISLVCSLYKILTKALANRLTKVVGNVVSQTKSSFVQGRNFFYGILIANELVVNTHKSRKITSFQDGF